jgi:tetratricopeptide (TPR) repeat protein
MDRQERAVAKPQEVRRDQESRLNSLYREVCVILSTAKKLIIGVAALVGVSLLMAQDPKPAATPEKHAKDEQEVALIKAVTDAKDPRTKVSALEKWAKEYPQTEFGEERTLEFMTDYQTAGMWKQAMDAAQEVLKIQPKNVDAYRFILADVYQLGPNASPADLQTVERVTHHVLDHLDEIYAADNMPKGGDANQWAQIKPQMKSFAQRTLGYIAMTAKDNAKAETELVKALEIDPTQAAASLWLGIVQFNQRTEHPEKQVGAIFQYARVAVYDGPGALDPANRDNSKKRFTSFYKQYHGSDEGAADVLALAKANALPPAGFTIKDIGTINHDKAVADKAARDADPMMAFWSDCKRDLTADTGQAFFDEHIKDTALPVTFKGKLVSHKPALRPKELVIAIEDPAGDLTIKLDEGQALPGKMEPGGQIEVAGAVGAGFTKSPYMLTVTADKAKITGWTGKNTPTPPRPGKSASKKG